MHDPDPKPHISRRRLLGGLAGVGAAAALTAEPAAAADGSPVLIGEDNLAKTVTTLRMSPGDASPDPLLWLGIPDDDHSGVVIDGPLTTVRGPHAGFGLHVVGPSSGVWAEAQGSGVALHAVAENGPSITSESVDGVALRLVPAGRIGPPGYGSTYSEGAMSVDQSGDLWMCVAAGDPGTWTRLLREDQTVGRTIPFTPIRVLDTRATNGRREGAPLVPGQVKGPLKGGQSVTLDLAGVGPIPSSATGVVGTATVVTPSTNGYLRLLPAGATVPAATVNYRAGIAISSGFTCGLSPTGLTAVAPIGASARYHLVIDIAAYIT